MINEPEQKQLIRRYLLGQLSAPERARFEDSYFAHTNLFEEVVALQDELVRSYLRGECPYAEKALLEERIAASPHWRQKVEFERSLMAHLSSIPAGTITDGAPATSSASRALLRKLSPLPLFRFAAVAIWVIVTLIGGAWVVTTNVRLRQEVAQLQVQKAELERHEHELQQQVTALNIKPPLAMPPFVLTSDVVRDTSKQKALVIPPGTSSVPLQLVLDQDDFPSYRAALETVEGARLWQQKDLKSQPGPVAGRIIAIELPSQILPKGTYILKLDGITAIGKRQEIAGYIFSVRR